MKNLVSILTLLLFCTLSSLSAKMEIKCPPDLDLGCIKSKSEIPKPNPEGVKVESDCRELKVHHVGDRLFQEGCKARIERTYQATNGCKEEISCRQIIWYIYDDEDPVFQNCDVKIDLGCNPDLKLLLPAADEDKIKATDNCGIEKISLIKEERSEDGCQFYSIRKYRAYDYCGNSTECKKVYYWTIDKKAPTVLKGPKNIDLGCNPKSLEFPKYDAEDFKIEDGCSEATVAIREILWDTTDCNKSRCTVYNIVDQCGNRTEYRHCVSWCKDVEAPHISCPKPLLLGCNPKSIPEADVSKIIAWDNCDKPLHIYVTASSISMEDCLYKLYRTYTVEDHAGNKNSCDEIFLWYESEGIHFAECPEDFDMGVLSGAPQYFPDFTIGLQAEGCGLDTSWYFDSEVMTDGCYSHVVRTWYIADVCGFKDSCQQTFSWTIDDGGISCPEDRHFPCTAKWDDMVPKYEVGEIIEQNECSGATLIFAHYAIDPLLNIDDCTGEFLLFYYLIEEGDTTFCTQAITWDLALGDCPCIDDITTLPPSEPCPEDLYISCSEDQVVPLIFESYKSGQFVSANTRGDRLYFTSKDSADFDCERIWYIHYHMIDASGHQWHCTQKITVEIESERCPCIDDLTSNPGDQICPKDRHFPCNTTMEEMFPYEEGQWLDSTPSGTQLIFNQYGFDIMSWECMDTRPALYFLIDSDGDTTRCSNIISWEKSTSFCGCIDDITVDPGSHRLCPEDRHFPCGTSPEILYPHQPGDWIASDDAGANLYFNNYGFDTIYECMGGRTDQYYIVHSNGDTTRCQQRITWDLAHDACPCIDDLTSNPGTICPKNRDYPCNTKFEQMFPYEPGQLLDSTKAGTQLIFDQYGFDILFFGCKATRTAHYFVIDFDGDTTRCSNTITWGLPNSNCGCIDDITVDPGSQRLCPEDLDFPCGTSPAILFPYLPGELVASDGAGANLYFNYYDFDITVYDCKASRTAHYYIVHANGLLSSCDQNITWDIASPVCRCIDDFTTNGHRMTDVRKSTSETIPYDLWLKHGISYQGSDLSQNADLFQIYPNPVLRDFTLEMKTDIGDILDIQVSDVQGKIWHKSSGDDQYVRAIEISSQSWPAGIYLVTILTDSGIQTKRLVKQ